MKTIAPSYYTKFKCIADKCQHSCCVGWEIDIDSDTACKYMEINGKFGNRLKDNIVFDGKNRFFKLGENERCPFLNNENLCDIILTLGEDKLCQICADHPRFRNFYSETTEIGLGLCCEAAARLILIQESSVSLIEIENDGFYDNSTVEEAEFFEFRNKLFNIFKNKELSIDERIHAFLKEFNTSELIIDNKENFFSELEILDSNWRKLIGDLDKKISVSLPHSFEMYAQQLLTYFTFRHLSSGLEDGLFKERARFIILSYRIIEQLCKVHFYKNKELNIDAVCEIARMYSSEIEYSQENIDAILNLA